MKNATDFCTCKDRNCPLNPVNHDRGCTPCILKNLKNREIPSCFFNSIDCEKTSDGFGYEDFASLVSEAKEKGRL